MFQRQVTDVLLDVHNQYVDDLDASESGSLADGHISESESIGSFDRHGSELHDIFEDLEDDRDVDFTWSSITTDAETMREVIWPRLRLAVLMLLVLTVLGMLCGEFIEGWSWITSLYVVVQVLTTIGYGDVAIHPTMKIVVAFYILACLVVWGYVGNVFFDHMQKTHIQMVKERIIAPWEKYNHTQKRDRCSKEMQKLIIHTVVFFAFVLFGTVFYRLLERCVCSYGVSFKEGCDDTDFETCEATGGYVKSWSSSFYMSVVTLTTVGFGDHTPRTQFGRLVGILWMVCGVATTVKWLQSASTYFFSRDVASRMQALSRISMDQFKHTDFGNKAYLTKSDFRCYAMVKLGLVPVDIFEVYDHVFDRLDTSGDGLLTSEECDMHFESVSQKDIAAKPNRQYERALTMKNVREQ